MYSFRNDYSEGAHENILEVLNTINRNQNSGYGLDTYSEKAAGLIRREIGDETADVHFLSGGTQTNLTVISSVLRPYEAVIAAATGHINVHEAGAIEATGHKVLTVMCEDGKLTPERIQPILDEHVDEHMVKPAMVYISNSTELGTIYTKNELKNLSDYCREKKLVLFLDGARLGAALCAAGNDLTLKDIADYTDCFYIGGTKNGALFGEALIITCDTLKKEFRFMMKQRGGLLAKGWLLGVQFCTLFEDGLYYNIASHANKMAEKLKEGIRSAGYSFLSESVTNQIFPIFTTAEVQKIGEYYDFEKWKVIDESKVCIRFVTSWATKEEDIDDFIEFLNSKIR